MSAAPSTPSDAISNETSLPMLIIVLFTVGGFLSLNQPDPSHDHSHTSDAPSEVSTASVDQALVEPKAKKLIAHSPSSAGATRQVLEDAEDRAAAAAAEAAAEEIMAEARAAKPAPAAKPAAAKPAAAKSAAAKSAAAKPAPAKPAKPAAAKPAAAKPAAAKPAAAKPAAQP